VLGAKDLSLLSDAVVVKTRYEAFGSPDPPPPPPAAALMVTAPFDAEEMVTLSPATIYEVPSANLVSEPLNPNDAVTTPDE